MSVRYRLPALVGGCLVGALGLLGWVSQPSTKIEASQWVATQVTVYQPQWFEAHLFLDGQFSKIKVNRDWTIKQVIEEFSLPYSPEAQIFPDLNALVNPAIPTVIIDNPVYYNLRLDGQVISGQTYAPNVSVLLKELDLTLQGQDFVRPALSTPMNQNIDVDLVRVETRQLIKEEPIGFQIIYQDSSSLIRGQSQVAQKGHEGMKKLEIEQILHDGKVVKETVLSENVVSQPVNTIIHQGTALPPANYEHSGTATWYRSPTAHQYQYVAASYTFAKGTLVTVTSHETGISIVVKITDYGPTPGTDRIIDLDVDAFEALGISRRRGVTPVTVSGSV